MTTYDNIVSEILFDVANQLDIRLFKLYAYASDINRITQLERNKEELFEMYVNNNVFNELNNILKNKGLLLTYTVVIDNFNHNGYEGLSLDKNKYLLLPVLKSDNCFMYYV
jgi:hypothetical protein